MAENKRKIGEKYERRAGAYLEEKDDCVHSKGCETKFQFSYFERY